MTRTDPDPRVRHRADALLRLSGARSLNQATTLMERPQSLRRWAERFLAEGRNGLVDRRRRGRPPNLDAETCALFAQAGIERRHFHDLRHSCGTFLASRNVHPRIIMEVLDTIGEIFEDDRQASQGRIAACFAA